MKLNELLTEYPRVKVADQADQSAIFSLIDRTAISTEKLHVSFDRKPDFYHFLRAQGENGLVFYFTNKDGTPEGFAASTFRRMAWNGKPISLGYTSDLRTTSGLDRDAKIQWRKFYGHGVALSSEIEEFDRCLGFVTAVWNENRAAQKALVNNSNKKKRAGDFSYNLANSYTSYSIWGRWFPLLFKKSKLRPIRKDEIEILLSHLCKDNGLSWKRDDLERSLSVFNKSFLDFQVLEVDGKKKSFVLPASTSAIRKTVLKRWPLHLSLPAKLLPLFGLRAIELYEPLEVLQPMFIINLEGNAEDNIIDIVDSLWIENRAKPKEQKFHVLAINSWDSPSNKPISFAARGYLSTEIPGALYKVTSEQAHPLFEQIQDFSSLEIGFL
jgi:hypothetical protein